MSPRFVLRSPLLPFHEFGDWILDVPEPTRAACRAGSTAEPDTDAARALAQALQAASEALRRRLRAVLSRPEVGDALFLASPGLQASLETWLREPDSPRGQKIERSLVRYFARMAGRATPFGLFSGVAVGRVGDPTRLELGERASYRRHTRLDNDYLFAVTNALGRDPSVRRQLIYRPNDSLFSAAGRLRYAEAELVGKTRSYRLVTVEPTDYLERTLQRARSGATLGALASALVEDDPELELDEAEEFLDELVDSQLLVSELAPAVTGREPIHGIVDTLRGCDAAAGVVAELERTAGELAAIDRDGPGASAARYRAVAERLERVPVPVELSRLFQVDMVKPTPEATLGRAVIDEVQRGVAILHAITRSASEDSLARFRRAFRDRYGDREVPLLEALDEEAGVGFEASSAPTAEASPLLAGLAFPAPPAASASWHPAHAWLLGRVHALAGSGGLELALDDTDLEKLAADERRPLPDALAVMVVVAGDADAVAAGRFQVFMDGASGPSGATLSGRFCHASADLHRAVEEHLRAEEALRPDALFAEVVHLNEGRIGNILCRPVLRDHEIPFLGVSGAPRGQQIPPAELVVSVAGDRVVLRSRAAGSRGREVVPRLTTAHNFRHNSIGVYRFLCQLQYQDVGSARWDWGPLADLPFLPRVTRGRLVFARARWVLSRGDLGALAEASRPARRAAGVAAARAATFRAVQALRVERGLPRWVVVVDADNELPVDLDNVLSCDTFAHLVRKRSRAVVCELYPAPDELPARGPEGRYASQVVLSFTRPRRAPPAVFPVASGSSPPPPRTPIIRRFVPGSEWLYVKLYAGTASCDQILRDTVAPLCRTILAEGGADSWFFIRYADPDHHLRVRWRGDPRRLCHELLPAVEQATRADVGQGLIWRIQVDTYEREVERYGGPLAVDLAETAFWIDSEAVAAIVAMLAGDEGADVRWRLAVAGADRLLDDLGLDLAAKHQLMQNARDSMAREFRADAAFHRQVGAKFRAERAELAALLDAGEAPGDHPLAPGLAALARRSERMRPVAHALREREARGELSPGIAGFAWSHVHMHLNRLLRSAQRAQELVIYDFLRRLYDARLARLRRGARR